MKSDSLSIPIPQLQEIKLSLDDALRCINVRETDDGSDPQKAVGRIIRVRAELVNVMGNISSDAAVKHDNMREELEKAIRLANGLHSHLSKLKLVA
jgi:hypothetical protein